MTVPGRVPAALVVGTLAFLTLATAADARGADPVAAQRVGGEDRYATAAMVAEAAFPSGSTAAVVVSGVDFADSLAASGLSGALADVAGVSSWTRAVVTA